MWRTQQAIFAVAPSHGTRTGFSYVASRVSPAGNAPIGLGPIGAFPAGDTRLATYENPVRLPWDGATAKIACWGRHIEGERVQGFAVNCAHLGCPERWV